MTPKWMARQSDSWLGETVTVRRVLANALFLILCVILPVVLALAWLGPR